MKKFLPLVLFLSLGISSCAHWHKNCHECDTCSKSRKEKCKKEGKCPMKHGHKEGTEEGKVAE